MHESRPSRTAYRVALRRAAHQILEDPLVFRDPLAIPISGAAEGALSRDSPAALRAFIVARSRFAEDELARHVAEGARQYVLLGAGLDTFGYRNPFANQGLRVFEVDHPATQGWKHDCLNAVAIVPPPSVTFVPVNFERENIWDRLVANGFAPSVRTFFAWLGVTPYLTREAFAATVHMISSMGQGTGVVFDFAVDRSRLGMLERLALDALASRVASAGEPFRLFFDPLKLKSDLVQLGFSQVELLDAAEINRRYFQNRKDGFRVSGGLGGLIGASV